MEEKNLKQRYKLNKIVQDLRKKLQNTLRYIKFAIGKKLDIVKM